MTGRRTIRHERADTDGEEREAHVGTCCPGARAGMYS